METSLVNCTQAEQFLCRNIESFENQLLGVTECKALPPGVKSADRLPVALGGAAAILTRLLDLLSPP
jgi:hypothetical protein